MEQTLIDFFAKSSELIFNNRVPTTPLPSNTLFSRTISPSSTGFQLSFARKVDFNSPLSSEWTSQAEKLLVIEFFVRSKATSERHLAEQWIFQITPGSHGNPDDTIDSPNTLYTKLSILLRTISLLTVTLPLYQKVVKERGSSCLSSSFIIEYSIHHTNDTLSTWHPTVYQNNDLLTYSGADFVLPGRGFSFKVNYSRSLRFLQKTFEEEFEHVEAEETPALWNKASLVRRAFSDNIHNKDMRPFDFEFLDDSNPKVSPFGEEDDACYSSQVESLQTRRRIHSVFTPKKELAPRVWDMSKVLDASKLKIKTAESESFGEGDIFLCENDEDKFTEVLSWKDISMRNQSPTRITIKEKDTDGSSGFPVLKRLSEDSDRNRMRSSVNMKPIGKILEQTNDDKVAELLDSIQDLKALAKRRESVRSDDEKVRSHESKEEMIEKGLRFQGVAKDNRGRDKEVFDPFGDMNELEQLYLQVKKLGPVKGVRTERKEV